MTLDEKIQALISMENTAMYQYYVGCNPNQSDLVVYHAVEIAKKLKLAKEALKRIYADEKYDPKSYWEITHDCLEELEK